MDGNPFCRRQRLLDEPLLIKSVYQTQRLVNRGHGDESRGPEGDGRDVQARRRRRSSSTTSSPRASTMQRPKRGMDDVHPAAGCGRW